MKAKLCPRGFQYRQAALKVGGCDFKAFDEILFCNFFYLHRTENIVLKNIYERCQAVLFMQGDKRRWPALLRIANTFGQPVTEGPEVKPTNFNLKIYEAFDGHAQAGMVSSILDGISDYESTVIVVPDGDFLAVLLTAVGHKFESFNISMGYPLKRSALYSLLTHILSLQLKRKGGLYYTKDYLKLLQHPLIKGLDLKTVPGLVRVWTAKVEEVLKGEVLTELSGRIFLDPQDIFKDEKLTNLVVQTMQAMGQTVRFEEIERTAGLIHKIFLHDFEDMKTASRLADALEGFISFMQEQKTMEQYPFNAQIALRLQEVSEELKACAFAYEIFEPVDLFKVLEERLSSEMVAFRGSPLRGLQILGLFETRSLNFKNVIIVDVNEGFLPGLNIYEPLIPREVMIKLNLDRLELEEEIQRYWFMRLISAAQNVHLLYQQNNDRTRSRFLEELIWEKEERQGNIGVVDITRAGFEVSVEKPLRVIPKTPEMIRFLKGFRFSASSINTYLQNPYAFYCRYVLGLQLTEDLLEDPESKHIGVFVHALLQETFGVFIGKKPVLDEGFRKYFFKIYESRFAQSFGLAGRRDTFLMETVIRARLEHFFDKEAKRCERDVGQILYIERRFEETLHLAGQQVSISYRMDRVDEMLDGSILLLDYKTGGHEGLSRTIDSLNPSKFSREYIRDHVKSFQMPLYVNYLSQQFPGRSVNGALYHLRTINIERFMKEGKAQDIHEILGVYWNALEFIMAEIYNPEIPFIEDLMEIK
ncbi:MAG: PD-(D/E)XK nuclease family protein [Candidatus Omnitrophica bacterium]|nr:PD-(D/E)XK nuclease family protein [Candidatus Omnitrophota bacterium]